MANSTLWPMPTTQPSPVQPVSMPVAPTSLQPTGDASDIQPGSFAEKLGAIDTGMYKSLPFGIGPKVLQLLYPKQWDQMQQAAKKNPGLATAGAIGGGLSQGLEMPALGAGKIFKGAAAVLPNVLARNAINAGVTALPGAITEAADTGNIGDAIKDFAKNTAIGTAGGVVLEKGLGALSKLAPKIKRGIANASLEGDIGIQARPFKQVVTGIQGGAKPGNIINRADAIRNQIIDLANSSKGTPFDISTEAGKIATVAKMEKDWDTLVDKTFLDFKAQGGKLSDLRNQIYTDPTVQQVVNAHPQMIDNLDSIIDTASKMADTQGIGAAREYLRKQVINHGMRNGASDEAYLGAQLGGAVHGAVDNKFVPPELKETYARDLLIKKVLASEELKVPSIAKSGSATAARLLTHAAMTGAGGLVPGAAAVGIGGIVNDLTAGALNKVLGKMATRISPALRNMNGERLQAIAGRAAPLVEKLGGLGTLGLIPSTFDQQRLPSPASVLGPQQQPEAPAADQVPLIQPPTGIPAGTQPIPNAPVEPQAPPPPDPNVQFIQAGNPPPQPEPKGDFGPFNQNYINSRLDEKYARYVRQYGAAISRDDYVAAARRATNNFDPDQPNTYKALTDDLATSERLFKAHMGLKQIEGTNAEDILNHYTRLWHKGAMLASGDQRREDDANARFVHAFSTMSGQPVKEVDQRLKMLAWDKGLTAEQRMDKINEMLVNEGGIDVPLLHRMGLW